MTSPREVMWLLLTVLLASPLPTESQSCGPVEDAVANNIHEASTAVMKNVRVTGAEAVTLTGVDTETQFDASQYIEAKVDGDNIQFVPMSNMAGILDYPNPKGKKTLTATVNVVCTGGAKTQFAFTAFLKDDNTATPQFTQGAYSIEVVENYPVNVPLSDLVIEASDFDADLANSDLTFTVTGTSFFTTQTPVQTSTWPANYSTQLVLKQVLDWTQKKSHSFTVTATDPGGLKSTSDVTVTVKDVDNHPPAFVKTGYTAEALDTKAVGRLTVKPEPIRAVDQDTGGSLQYTLVDLPNGKWKSYFSLDPNTAELQLAREIPDEVTTPSEISFTLVATETGGMLYTCQSTLVIFLTPQPGEPDSDVGYIVGLAVLACLLVIVIIVAAIMLRKTKRTSKQANSSGVNTDWEAASGQRDRSGGTGTGVPAWKGSVSEQHDNLAFARDKTNDSSHPPVESSTKQGTSAGEMTHSLYPNPHTVSETTYGEVPERRQSIKPISDDHNSGSPMVAATDDVTSTAPPIEKPPEEPQPDYKLKSVGFNNTVVCVTPVEPPPPDDVEADDDDDDGEDKADVDNDPHADNMQNGEKTDGGAQVKDHDTGSDMEEEPSEGVQEDSDASSML